MISVVSTYATDPPGQHPARPRLSGVRDGAIGPLSDGDHILDVRCRSWDAPGLDVADLRLMGCHLLGAELTSSRFEGLSLTDCRLQACDLSGAVLEPLTMVRVELVDCRLSAAVLAGAVLTDVRVHNCKIDEANLRFLRCTRTVFEECVLARADLQGSALGGCDLLDCDLRGADLSKAVMDGTRLAGSRLEGVAGAAALRGAWLTAEQIATEARTLAAAAGVRLDRGDTDPAVRSDPPAGRGGTTTSP